MHDTESDLMTRPELDLAGFLDRLSSPEHDHPHSRDIWHPVPTSVDAESYLRAYVRNFGMNDRGVNQRSVFTIANVRLHPTVAQIVADPLFETRKRHGSGAFRDFLYQLSVMLPDYGFKEIMVETVQNRHLEVILMRYGFHHLAGHDQVHMIKSIDGEAEAALEEVALPAGEATRNLSALH